MKLRPILVLALRNIFSRRGGRGHRLLGAAGAIAVSLIPLIVVLEVANGMIEGISNRFLEVGTYHIQVPLRADLANESDTLASIEALSGVRLSFIEKQGLAIAYSPRGRIGVQVRSVPPDLFLRDETLRRYFNLVSGSFDLSEPGLILLGRIAAQELGVEVGDEVKLLTAKPVRGTVLLPKRSLFRIAGVFSIGYQDMDRSWMYISREQGESILPPENSHSFIGVKLDDPFGELSGTVEAIRRILPTAVSINTWYRLEENQYRSFQTTKILLVFIMGLIVLVASVNVSSSMMMIVLEKTQEIGILKSMGASATTISLSFVVTGFYVGILGTVAGVGTGLALAININELILGIELLLNRGLGLVRALFHLESSGSISLLHPSFYLETIPIRIFLPEVALVAFSAILLATLASWLPARRASKMRPMVVLRKV
jgi:lipoprotein-releasing system permease protein